MKFKHLFTISTLGLVAFGSQTRAGLFEDATSGAPKQDNQAQAATKSPVELSGYVRGDLYLGKVPDQNVTEIKNGFGEAAAKLRVKLGDWGDGRAEIRAREGYDGAGVSGTVGLREAFVDLYLGPVDIRFGHQVIVWGRADAFNPTDNLTPHDMGVRSPDEDDRRGANLALKTSINFNPLRWEFIYLPFYAPSHFPVFTLPGPISFSDPAYPDADFEHGTLATRLNVELPKVDFSVSYLFGYSTFPGIELASFTMAGASGGPEVAIRFHPYQHHVVGADFATTVGDWLGLRGEVALNWPVQHDDAEYIPQPELQYVLGVDHDFGDVSLIVQYVGRTVLDWEAIEPTGLLDLAEGRTPTPEQLAAIMQDPEGAARTEIKRKTRMTASQTEHISHAATVRIAWQLFHETLTLEMLGYYNLSTKEWLVRPMLSYDIADGLAAIVGGEIYGGPDETLFGTIDEVQSAGFVELKAYF
jgi:hypothetical protein